MSLRISEHLAKVLVLGEYDLLLSSSDSGCHGTVITPILISVHEATSEDASWLIALDEPSYTVYTTKTLLDELNRGLDIFIDFVTLPSFEGVKVYTTNRITCGCGKSFSK